ncbi:uncharacterized protein LOC110230714 [Arabidopsis lyrata subsp. lyrata]|uniref:uncharacterized protein LOC110230714 n=1 Tax=Arabidopsis lyrata subsp. lyrata TaxID=81972 RepID=UPI000A29D5C8|nr:uncharacterized protein LOC110230714 [Arabidopsis lyrata subsp. lyrata]|eukprot:XP_020889950.1 uncharacterized protein LOC110230714 [Arabidopsis lyrata subsp. lyrata]
MRAMGRNMDKTKLACFQVKHKCMAQMQENQIQLQQKVTELEDVILKMKNQRQSPEVGENSAARSVNKRSQPKCVLIDWAGSEEKVAEGLIMSSDPDELVNESRLGLTDVKVLIVTAIVPEAFLWRPAINMCTIEKVVGHMVAWPSSLCVNLEEELQPEDIATLGSRPNSVNKCKLLDLSSYDVVVAEGRWQTQDANALVNGLPLGPAAVKIFVDAVIQPETYIWRPTIDVMYLEDCLQSSVAWPANKVVFENHADATCQKSPLHQASASTHQTTTEKAAASGGKAPSSGPLNAAAGYKSSVEISKSVATTKGTKSVATVSKSIVEKSPATCSKPPVKKSQLASHSPLRRSPRKTGAEVIKANQKCKLMDISGKRRVVGEGRVHSIDPDQKVHHVRLGANAARVWVDVVKIDDAAVWRPSDEIEYMRDSLGSSIAWPMDKLVIY